MLFTRNINLISLLLVFFLVVISGCDLWSSVDKLEITVTGTAIRSEDEIPLKNVKVVLFGNEYNWLGYEEATVAETLTDEQGQFNFSVVTNNKECEKKEFSLYAWLYIVKPPEVSRSIDNDISVKCTEEIQNFILELIPNN